MVYGLRSRVSLLLIGDGPMRGALEAQAARLGVADSVFFLGSRPHEEVALWMNVADCLCLPSRSESSPNVVREALACGLPVVAADVGDVTEVVKNGVNGFVVGAGCSDAAAAFAAALVKALSMEWDRQCIAGSAPMWGWDQAAGMILGLMRVEKSEHRTVNIEHLTSNERTNS